MILGRCEILKSRDQILPAREVRSCQGFGPQDAKPDLDLIEPRRGGLGKVKGHIGMTTQLLLVFLVGLQIIQDHMNVLIGRIISHDLIHEFLEVFPLLVLSRLAPNDGRWPLPVPQRDSRSHDACK